MKKNSFSYDDLIQCGDGDLFGPGNAKLPLPPMLMFDRISKINENDGEFKKGSLSAELDVKKDLWFFDCHFKDDPVMPGCLGLDAMWQLVGFFLGWLGNPGKGRALGVGTVKFTGEVLQNIKLVKYKIDMKKILDVLNVSTGKNSATLDKFPNRILTGTYDAAFKMELMYKDLQLYLTEARNSKLPVNIAEVAKEYFQEGVSEFSSGDFTEIYKVINKNKI